MGANNLNHVCFALKVGICTELETAAKEMHMHGSIHKTYRFFLISVIYHA